MQLRVDAGNLHTSGKSRRFTRRGFLKAAAACAALPLATGVYAREIEPFWLDFHEVSIDVVGLPRAFDGFRIAHLTDLHIDHHIPGAYLHRIIDRVNDASPDLVCVTGDIVNHAINWTDYAAELLAKLRAPVLASFGNHDYAPMMSHPGSSALLATMLHLSLARRGCTVLRNSSVSIARGTERLWFVGLEDFWTNLYSPQKGFARVPGGAATICLSHNPDTAPDIAPFAPKLILSGHTHGGQVRAPLLGAPLLPVAHREFEQGLFKLDHGAQLYVSRGVGFLLRARLFCRPELPIFKLREV